MQELCLPLFLNDVPRTPPAYRGFHVDSFAIQLSFDDTSLVKIGGGWRVYNVSHALMNVNNLCSSFALAIAVSPYALPFISRSRTSTVAME